jgi:hypothetical protein
MSITEHRAGQLAGLAQLEQLALPAAVATAISGYERIMALPVPAPPERGADRRAITDQADRLARDALTGKRPAVPSVPLDVSPVTRARQDDQAALDRAALARELRDAAATVLVQVFSGDSGQQVVGALQARHAEVMAELVRHARLLPEAVDQGIALEHGGEVRESYLACRDLTGLIAQLRQGAALIEDPPTYMPDDLERCLGFEKTGRLYATAWLAPAGISTHGPLGSLEFYLSACRETDYEWWLPTHAEVEARAAQFRERQQAARVRGLNPAQVF